MKENKKEWRLSLMINENEEFEEYALEIPAGEEGIPGDHLDEVDDLEEILLSTEWIDEAKNIPLDALNQQEQLLILKCINKEQFTDDEQEQLQQILAQYRPAIRKVKPDEILENAKANQKLVTDINEFLDISENFNKVQELKFPINVNGNEALLYFDVHPVLDSTAILDMNKLTIFQDFTQDEFITMSKQKRGENLTREEMLIAKNMEEKLNRLSQDKAKEMILEFLSMQLTFHGQDNTYDEMKTALTRIPLAYLITLFYQVQNMTGVTDVKVENVFQERS